MENYYRVRAELSVSALKENFKRILEKTDSKSRVMAVVKSNAYGHGIEHVVPVLDQEGADAFAVASVQEGVQVRKLTNKSILVLGFTHPSEYVTAAENHIMLTVFSLEQAQILSEIMVRHNLKADIHIKIETGMQRIGFVPNLVNAELIRQISKLPAVTIRGYFTHFSRSDEKDKSHAQKQMDTFLSFMKMLEKRGLEIPLVHMANSAAIMEMPSSYAKLPYPSMVRAGIMLYGLYPSGEMDREAFALRSVMSLSSHIVHLKWVEKGTPVGYGGSYEAEKDMRIATVPVGYGDGYPRHLSNTGYVLIHGQKAPIRGRVCMDQMMVDVTDIPEARLLDKVILFNEDLSVETLADLSGTISYEIVCQLTDRVERFVTD
ncbi:MAG: alanine racemase [Firmicutes bacterium]|nr:alanine racemase [Bacillota bacterium]